MTVELSQTMWALRAEAKQVIWQRVPRPTPKPNQVLIKTAYAGLNRADLMQAQGLYPPPAGVTDVLGLEVSGEVVACGAAVDTLTPGTEVCALLSGGGLAEYVCVSADQVLARPAGVTLATAAGLCEVYATVWFNLFMLAQLKPSERVLIHAGASGVGSAALQLLTCLGYECATTVGSENKAQWVRELGADLVWNRQQGSFVQAVKDWGGVDVILDPVAGDYLQWDQHVLHQDGRIVVIGLLGGRSASIDTGRLLIKRQSIIGSTLRSQSAARKAEIVRQLRQQVWPLIAHRLQPRTPEVFAATEVATAFAQLEQQLNCGKLVIDMSQLAEVQE